MSKKGTQDKLLLNLVILAIVMVGIVIVFGKGALTNETKSFGEGNNEIVNTQK